jgi:hypothetical protein
MLAIFRSAVRSLLLTALILIGGSAGSFVLAQDNVAQWENFDFAASSVDLKQLKGLGLEDLKYIRGIVFGRHGRIFKDVDIQQYLKERPWYKPDPAFQNSMLVDIERRNLDVIREAEAAIHDFIQPGDLRFYQRRAITVKKLGEHTGAEWLVLAAEVEAIHGKRFEETWLQQYFDERYWYAPNAQYDPKQLTTTEQKNLQTISLAHKRHRNVAVSPGDMELFQNTILTEAQLRGVGLHELRLLRNEFYARRGKTFTAEWLQQYFNVQPWYFGAEADKQPGELPPIEKQNVETIVKVEQRLREELSKKVITRRVLEGLFIEDARKLRNEIYARHGKVFDDQTMRNYFSTFDWYKPDPKFNENSLSRIERQNYAAILAYERKARSAMDVIEG